MPAQLAAPPQPESTPAACSTKSFRLDGTVVPRRYEIRLCADVEQLNCTGHETIEVVVKQATDRIVLNAVELHFLDAFVESADGTRLDGKVEEDGETELAAIVFDGILGPGLWQLKIAFRSQLSEKLRGFYRSFWVDGNGHKHTIAATHFEPTHARRAFPCFDEPEYKATFKIFLEIDENLTALSNGKILRETRLGSGSARVGAKPAPEQASPETGSHESETASPATKKIVEFAETMLLSTYLVAFVVGEFVSSEMKNVNGTEIRVWCVPGKEHLTPFALSCASFSVDFYERYFETPYLGQKIDHVAIPDFPIGAMENLGLITFRETALLVDQNLSSHAGLLRVAEVVMHELAHMWFGDLVTMRWWNGLWLKESFATFMANVCLDSFRPGWQVWNDFALSRADAFDTDALKNTHAIESSVNHPDEATEMFDVISYQKGCSVLYQLHEFIGAETFRKGCSRYLKKHCLANTETEELWEALEEAAITAGLSLSLSVGGIMDAWVFNCGHPVIFVERAGLEGFMVLKQAMFRFDDDGETSSFIWPVPVAIRVTRSDGEIEIKKFLMRSQEEIVYLGEDIKYFIVNALGSGFYRVVYDKRLIEMITGELYGLSTVERFNLINDTWSMVRAGLMPVGEYIAIIRLYRNETYSAVWQVIYDSLEHLDRLLDDDDKPLMSLLIHEVCAPNLARLGWTAQPSEPVETRKLRALVIKLMGVVAEDATIKATARELYDRWRNDSSTLDAELVPTVVHIVAHDGDEKQYTDFLNLSRDASTPQDTIRFLYALARFRRPDLLAKTASLCMSPEVRSQDAPFLFAAILRNKDGGALAWDFLKANLDQIKSRFPDLAMHRMIEALCLLDTPQLESDVRKFFLHNRIKTGETVLRQMLEQLHINVRLRQKEKAALKAALAN